MSERITVNVIANKDFQVRPMGYDQDEVDSFLDEICDELDRIAAETADLKEQLREAQAAASRAAVQPAPKPAAPAPQPAPKPAAPASGGNAEVMGILELANRLKEETLAEARKQAEQIIEKANTEVRTQMGGLMEERDSLTHQVEALRKTAADYRERFTGLLKAQQDALEKISDL